MHTMVCHPCPGEQCHPGHVSHSPPAGLDPRGEPVLCSAAHIVYCMELKRMKEILDNRPPCPNRCLAGASMVSSQLIELCGSIKDLSLLQNDVTILPKYDLHAQG